MLTSSFEDKHDFLAERARTEHEDHHEGVWKADFRTIDGAISCGLKDSEERVDGRVCDDLVEFSLSKSAGEAGVEQAVTDFYRVHGVWFFF